MLTFAPYCYLHLLKSAYRQTLSILFYALTLDYLQKKLALSFRKRITNHFHDAYLKRMHYYKICNLDSRISNPDQRLTTDAEKWA